jgi:MoaA/NifB/PqqE/SkfB family radical SAM enzyme
MTLRSVLRHTILPLLDNRVRIKSALQEADITIDQLRHSAAGVFPQLIRPDPRSLYISLTANCNLRCKGCLYGREFMAGHQLPLPIVKDLLDDAKSAGFESVRLYGGEPLLHRDLPGIVEHAAGLSLGMWVTTNGVLLRQRIDALVSRGLRRLSVGFYGVGEEYENYVQRKDTYRRMGEGVAYVRDRYGMDVSIHLDWVLMRPTCSIESLEATWKFAERYHTPIYVNLIHYSLPYFVTGEDRELQFEPGDRPAIESVVAQLLRLKRARPELLLNSTMGLNAIPDWLMKGSRMRVPCTAYRLIWVGPDGTVQMCYVTFKLGNLHEKRLKEMLFTVEHQKAARESFLLNCPNCHCGYEARTLRHAATRRLYK